MREHARRHDTILPRLIASIVGAVTLASFALIYPIIVISADRNLRDLKESASSMADRLAETLSIPARDYVEREVEFQLELAMSDPNAYSASLSFRDANRPTIAAVNGGPSGAEPAPAAEPAPRRDLGSRGIIVERREVAYRGRTIADLELAFVSDKIERRFADSAKSQAFILLILDVILVIPLLLLLRVIVIAPLRRIEKWAEAVSLGNAVPLPPVGDRGEIASLRNSIGRMVRLLGERYDAMVVREREFRSLFESSPVATYELDFSPLKAGLSPPGRSWSGGLGDIRIKAANAAALRPLGLSSPPERVVDAFGESPEVLSLLAAEADSFLSGSPAPGGDVSLTLPDGSRRTYAVSITVLAGHENDWSRVIVTASDLTDRVTAENGLRKALAEKESLIQELFHRTLNSLQTMASMVSLRSQRSRDGASAAEFAWLELRIRTLALAQEQLSRSGDPSQVDLGTYLKDVLSMIAAEASGPVGRIAAVVESGPLPTLIDVAIPVGMIAAELASNSIAHAFPGGRSGTISAVLERGGDGAISISVRDDGAGPPPGFDPRRDASLGLEMAISLVERQLMGSIGFDFSSGFRCDLRFNDGIFERRV